MKKQLLWGATIASLLLMTGCAPKFESLSAEQKRDFYERVAEEAQDHRERGEFYERIGYLELALEEYERANFYGAVAPVDPARMAGLRAKIAKESQAAFRRAETAEKRKDFRRALAEYNAVLRHDSRHAEAAKRRDALLAQPETAMAAAQRDERLKALLAQPKTDAKEQREVEKLIDELLTYRHDHPTAYTHRLRSYEENAKEKKAGNAFIRQGRHALMQNDFDGAENAFKQAQALGATQREGTRGLADVRKRKDAIHLTGLAKKSLAAGNDAQAEIHAKKAVAADADYAPARALLAQITRDRARFESGERLKKGREYLASQRYLEAMEEAQAILEADPDHAEAKKFYADVQRTLKSDIGRLLKEGEQLFDQNRFDESTQRFESVLVVEPDNNVSQPS